MRRIVKRSRISTGTVVLWAGLARMVRIVRAVPELVTLIKSMTAAVRSVFAVVPGAEGESPELAGS